MWTEPTGRQRVWVVSVAALALGVCGCGGDVTGRVTANGKPVTGGWVSVHYPDGGPSPLSGAIRPDGTYRIPGCPAGPAKITVRPPHGGVSKRGATPAIPAKYTDVSRTDLQLTVSGNQTFDIDLKP